MPGPSRAKHARTVLASLLFCGVPVAVQAHEIHSTLMEITRAADGTVSVRVRTFADDFSLAVARHIKGTPRRDFVTAHADAARYMEATMVLTDSRGRTLPLTLVSQQRSGEVVWLELRGPRSTLAGASIRNAMLFEVHEDQVNIVKASYDRTSYTTLLSSGDRAKRLP